MDDETHVNEDVNSGSPIETPAPASYGVFSRSQHFTVAGGTFTNTSNTTNNYHTTVPSDYRRIPMGDIDLQREIRLGQHSGIAEYRHEQHSIRKLYSAKIPGQKSSVTVATYQGQNAAEEWRRDVAQYMAVRHPNIVQLCGTASSGNIHATIFHGDLIPIRQFMELHRHSPISNVYIYAYMDVEFHAVQNYFASTFEHWVDNDECTFFVRRSTGRICVDLAPEDIWLYTDQRFDRPEFKSLNAPSLERAALDFLTLEQYHEICYWQLSQPRTTRVYPSVIVNLGVLTSLYSGNPLEDLAVLPRPASGPHGLCWDTPTSGVVLQNGWTRLSASDAVANIYISLNVSYPDPTYWLAQANHIFKHLGISTNLEDYAVRNEMEFLLHISPIKEAPPTGFLFLCPPADFQTGLSSFTWPERPAYWSFDPTGADPLRSKDAANRGLPYLQLSTEVCSRSWDASVYAGLRQFHQAKGFDPESQAVTRHLGQPLLELSSAMDGTPFAHIDDKNFRPASDGDAPTRATTEEEFKNGSQLSDTHHDASYTSPSHSDLADAPPVLHTLKYLIYVQLSLIVGLASFWLYDHAWSPK